MLTCLQQVGDPAIHNHDRHLVGSFTRLGVVSGVFTLRGMYYLDMNHGARIH
jgi:hypothetical protein